MSSYGFHSEAADDYFAATRYYLDHASPLVAAAFVAEIEAAINTLLASPTTWPVIEEPEVRRTCSGDFLIQFIIAGSQN